MVHSEAQKLRKGCKGLPPGSSVGVEGASLRKTDAFMEAHPFGEVSRVLETVGGGNTPPDSSPAASPRPKSTAEAQRDRLLKRVEAGGIEPPS